MEKNISYNHRPWPWLILLTSYKLITACGQKPRGSEEVADTREGLVGRKHMGSNPCPVTCSVDWKDCGNP